MKIVDIFSKRQKRLRGEFPDVYQYETIPHELRIQIIYIWRDAFGPDDTGGVILSYRNIHDVLCREYGVFGLSGSNDTLESVRGFFLRTENTEKAIDVIELSFKCIDENVRSKPNLFPSRRLSPDEAIDELNHRFREHGVGYRYESSQIIRVDSEFIHSEVVKPVLSMLSDPMYEGANAEFLKAHEHYRAGRHKECMNECLKAFESCIKAICEARGWDYEGQRGIRDLIGIVFERGLIPTFMQSHFTALRKTLEDGVPTLRNQRSGHGQGPEEVPVPEYIAAYTLHLTASNILFLARANEEMG